MRRTRKLVAAGCICAAMATGMTAFAMPGATSLVTVTPRTASSASSDDTDQAQRETAQEPETQAVQMPETAGAPAVPENEDTNQENAVGTPSKVTVGAASLTAASNVSVAASGPEGVVSQAAVQMAAASPTEVPSPYKDVAVSQVNGDDDYVNIRDEASTEGEILGKIYNNCAATIEETVEKED